MTDHFRIRAALTAAALVFATSCADALPTSELSARPAPDDSTLAVEAVRASFEADIAVLDARIANRRRGWFSLEPQTSEELLAQRRWLADGIAKVRARTSAGTAALYEEEGGSAAPPTVDGWVTPQIEDQKVYVRTRLMTSPPQYCNAELAHSGSYGGMHKRPGTTSTAISGTLTRVTAVLWEKDSDYAMPIAYDATRDTVSVTANTTHGGRWFAQPGYSQWCTGGTMQSVPKSNYDYFAAPAPPPPEEEERVPVEVPSGGGGAEGEGGGSEGCDNVEPYYIDHYWYYPRTDSYEYRYTQTKYYCADEM